MARPTTEKICIVCGKPFLPTGGRQLKCKRCGGKQRKKSGLEQAVQNADAQGISYGKYMSTKHKEEKTMAEQEKTAEVGTVKAQTAENQVQQVQEQVQQEQDTLQEYIRYLNQQGTELTARLKHIRIALEEAAAYDVVRHSGWRQHKENPRTGGNR